MKSASGNPNPGPEPRPARLPEALRWLLLAGGALWLSHPYFSPRLIGSGDALWYHHLLADAVLQFRAGEFPVYVGQSEFMFNGAVYPHRVAPYHQYLAGLIDLLTGRSLGFFALQHLTLIVTFVGGALAGYFTLTRLDPLRRWSAALLALLYVACPGVMGLAYAQDLYMSVMAIPWVPLALGGAWLTFRENSWRALGMIVAGLGMLWWAHSPIALWTTACVGLQQIVRLAFIRPVAPLLRRGVPAAGALALLVAYPVVSAFLLRAPGESVVPYRMDRALLLKEIQDAFPASILPLNSAASPLSQLQLGYSLGALVVVLAIVAASRRSLRGGLAFGMVVLLLLLVLPVPGLTRVLWLSFPEPVVGLSLYWPMQRLYIIAAALLVVGLTAVVARAPLPRWAGPALLGGLLVGAGWSAWQARVFLKAAAFRATLNAESAQWGRTENATPMRHAYHLFGRQPATMSHGVMDPALESRLLDPVTGAQPADPAPVPATRTFTGTLDANPGILNLEPALRLEPRRRYRLDFEFLAHDYTGILQITGPEFFREYALPASGNPRAFGTGAAASRSLGLWTTRSEAIDVRLRFIPTAPGARAAAFTPFARFDFSERVPAQQPVEIHGLVPYRATVRTRAPAVLETPRMAVPGYTAMVNGAAVPVVPTLEGFVGVPVPAGLSAVEVRFTGPLALRLAFGLSALAWLALPLATWRLGRRPVD